MAALVRSGALRSRLWQWQQIRTHMLSRKQMIDAQAAESGLILTAAGVVSQDRPTYTRLLPCPTTPIGQRIEHLLVKRKAAAVNIICDVLRLPTDYVVDLFSFGAVHYARRVPKPPAKLTNQQAQLFKKASPKKWAKLETISMADARKTARISDPNHFTEPGSYLRVHVHPKRFPRCYEIDWASRIIANEESFVVMNKPAGVSVGGSVDNVEEMCVTFASRALNLEKPLVPTHQLDNCTEGCLLLAKSNEFASHFHKLLKENKVEKFYLALAAAPVPVGKVTHYMRSDKYPPRIISSAERVGWQLCAMKVLECNEVPWPSETALSDNRIADCGWTKSEHAYECKVQLLTGITHQLRAQFSAMGSPLIGDSMYMPGVVARLNSSDIDPFLKLDDKERKPGELKQAEQMWISKHGGEPGLGIGLQSCEISWQDGEETMRFTAGPPWWRESASDEKM